MKVAQDLDKLIANFEKVYTSIYPIAVTMPEAGHAITSVGLEAHVQRMKPVVPRYPLKDKEPPKSAHKGQREVYHRGWMKFDLWEMDLLEAGNRVEGPAIIEHPMTTLVIPPDKCIELDERKIMWYRDK